jgi:hypothetical protein
MKITNSTACLRHIIMKFKLMYSINGKKMSEERKMSKLPEDY